MTSSPRLILICCEGKTEKAYFEIIRDVFRGLSLVAIEIFGEEGQHKALIDETAKKRTEQALKYGLEEFEIRSWAVCDEDKSPVPYHELLKYASRNEVELAFSSPFFEAFLIQHFEQSKETSKAILYNKLTGFAKDNGLVGKYARNKADLRWLERAIRNKPKLVKTAIINSEQRTTSTKAPFLTVHRLVRELIDNEI